MIQVFLAGIMQGSRADRLIDDQDYRLLIAEALQAHVPDVHIIDPLQRDPNSVEYDGDQARQAFETNTAMAGEADVLIAYLPEASMGTAIEMWTAYQAKAYIITVSPLKHNWVINLTSDEVLPDLDSLMATIENGHFKQLAERLSRRGRS